MIIIRSTPVGAPWVIAAAALSVTNINRFPTVIWARTLQLAVRLISAGS